MNIQQQLAQAYQWVQQGELNEARSLLDKLVLSYPNNTDAFHLLALVFKAQREFELALKNFEKCLKINVQQPQVHNNLANLHKDFKNLKQAEQHYQRALDIQPDFYEAKRNLALCYVDQGKQEEAIKLLRSLLQSNPRDVVAINSLASCYRDGDQFVEAKLLFDESIKIDSQRAQTWHAYGVLHHLQQNQNEAIKCYQKALQAPNSNPETIESLAAAYHEQGNIEKATELVLGALRDDYANLRLHELYNHILWNNDQLEQFGHSYTKAIEQFPEEPKFRRARARSLFKAGFNDLALESVRDGLRKFPEDAELLTVHAELLAEAGDIVSSKGEFIKSLTQVFSKETAQQLCKLYILNGDYVQAQALLDQLLENDEYCQLSWALQSLLWRFCNNEMYQWLTQYSNFIKSYQLSFPDNYESSESYLTDLAICLRALHTSEREPLLQTLKHGTQTAAKLLNNASPEIVYLKSNLTSIVHEYINELPEDFDHPFLTRKSQNFQFSGSWSVELKPNGYHINHVHSQGWISSSCYIDIPSSIELENEKNQGCIKFGESPLHLGEREIIEKIIKPKPGMVVLFPSYLWHGTVPFLSENNETRLTAPFDVTPL